MAKAPTWTDTDAEVRKRQYRARGPPSPLVFLLISTHFTATLEILPPSLVLEFGSIECSSQVKPGAFTSN